MRIGILALQGAVREHKRMVEACGQEAVAIKRVDELADIDGLILPGGESTAMRRLMDRYGFTEALRESDLPMFGTCAGVILLAERIIGQDEGHLGKLDITVERNSFGRQVDSFEAELDIEGIGEKALAVFIRAPHIDAAGKGVQVLSKVGEKIVAVRSDRHLGISFHPELTDSLVFHRYFIEMVQENMAKEVLA
ncbi:MULTISPECIES: pyridoxal 5'-phosphate synthase glutaminase subunit PdxT [Salinicoccus]|uniref:pyridoxal 5'-phosphate synthase glutaminase subunit PdxT n=1 Tax=Salinicoccus TaxID=45669 RepID=UPI0004E0FC83|nr:MULTISPECIES: pyridoxal 5'-phosphate synthase glutaminase subunit PdxT [Salinicoccus]MCC4722775.1 pyridoxal 5'-phosphate synthase glutaminase subunit PdxT [Salinicoccus sp. RF5]